MSAPTIRRAIQLLPRNATTSLGSLPLTQLELGMQAAFQLDIPCLPQLPVGKPSEFMIPAALEGLPGLHYDEDGTCTVDVAEWTSQREAFDARVEKALATGALESFEPSPEACRAWRPFVWEVEHRKLALAKAQLAGPFTVEQVVRTSTGAAFSDVPGLDRGLFRLLLARSLAMVTALRRAGVTPLFFLDEPGLYAYQRTDPRHLLILREQRVITLALQQKGALVGVHCCSNTAWKDLLDAGLDLLSLDVRLSLDALLQNAEAVERFFASGATLSLGLVPTDLRSTYSVPEMVRSIETSLKAALPHRSFAELVEHMPLTPACGLAMRTPQDAERILAELKEGQKLLRARMPS